MNKNQVSIKTEGDFLQINIPVSTLICAFNRHPDNMNCNGDQWATIKEGKKQEFMQYVITNLLDDGAKAPRWAESFDLIFEGIFEDALDDFIDYNEEE